MGHWYDINSVEVPRYHKWSRHVIIMATRFLIWALQRELSCKNVSVEFQVATFSASVKFPALSIIMAIITVHSNCDYDDVLVCVHVLCCHVRCMRHVKGAMSCGLALACLWWICGSYTPSSCVWKGWAAAAGNVH